MVHPVRTGPSTISSLNQFGGSGVVTFSAGGVSYQLTSAATGSALQDIMVDGATAAATRGKSSEDRQRILSSKAFGCLSGRSQHSAQ
jgi:hypothetical protein